MKTATSFLSKMSTKFYEARMRSAMKVIHNHRHLLQTRG
jgi:hypothetical protein